MADCRLWFDVACNAFRLADMACSKAMSTAELVMIGGDSDVTGGLVCWMASDLLLPKGCDEEFLSSGVTRGCMLETRTWNRNFG